MRVRGWRKVTLGGVLAFLLAAFALSLSASTRADSPEPAFETVSAGAEHTCGIRADGELACWGDDSLGQLDEIPPGQFVSVSAGDFHTCAIAIDRQLVCWGDDSSGQLDEVPTGEFLSVSAGGAHSCAIRLDGDLVCWGDDSSGQLDEAPSGEFLSVSAGGAHSCAIRLDGDLVCWGDDSSGQASGGPDAFHRHHNDRHHHHDKDDPPKLLAVSAGGAHTCGIDTDHDLDCWGDDSSGQLDGIPSGNFVFVSAGTAHSCAIRASGDLACWGEDSSGQLDEVPAGEFLSVSAGGAHSCAVRADGARDCWGSNASGQVQPELIGGALERAVIDEPYTHQFETTPQAPDPLFHVSGGALPDGLGLEPDGELSGTPTTAGSFAFTVAAANGIVPDAEREETLEVVGSPLLAVSPAQDVTTASAGLKGSIDPRNLAAEAWFEYWPAAGDPKDAKSTPVQAVAEGLVKEGLSAGLAGLSPGTEYSFRLAATNELGPEPLYSETASLTTATPPVVLAAVDPGLPDPTAGENFNVDPLQGIVKVKCPRQPGASRIAVPTQVPLACQIDTNHGTAKVTTSKGSGAGTQSADFWGGAFGVDQDAAHGWDTELRLAGRLKCEKRKGAGARASGRSFKSKKGRGRKLWGSGKGNYSTSGNYGSASVRGTTWLVADRCDSSTLISVREGTVWVKDFVTGKTPVLQAGESYVAKAAIPTLR